MRDRNIQRRNYQNNASMKNFRKTASLPMRVLMSSAIALSLSSIPIDIPLCAPQHNAAAQEATIVNNQAVADHLQHIGLRQLEQSQFQTAIQIFQQALEIYEQTEDLNGASIALNNIGEAHRRMGNYYQALEFYQQALAIELNADGYDIDNISTSNVGVIFNNIGLTHYEFGQYSQALVTYERALEVARKFENRIGEGITLNNIGKIYNRWGKYSQALTAYEEALVIAREVGNRIGEGVTLNNIGKVYDNLGMHHKSLDFYQRSLAITQETNNISGESTTFNNIGMAYQNLDQHDLALNAYQRSLNIARNIGDSVRESITLNNIGALYSSIGEYSKALDIYHKIINASQLANNKLAEAVASNNAGLAYQRLGKHSLALRFYRNSLSIRREIGDRGGEAVSLNNLGLVLLELERLAEAENRLSKAIKINESLRTSDLEDAEYIFLFDMQANAYLTLQRIVIAQDKFLSGLEISERGRTQAFARQVASHLLDQSNLPATVFWTSADSLNIFALQRIARRQNATLVQYSIAKLKGFDPVLYIWTIKPNGEINFHEQNLADYDTDLAELVDLSRGAIGARGRSFDGTVTATLTPDVLAEQQAQQRQTLQELYKLLIEPIAAELPTDPNEHVIFIPHQELFLVPFAALMNAEGEYLIENHTIRTAPSIQVLGLTHELDQQADDNASMEALIVGNPIMPEVWNPASGSKEQLSSLTGAEDEAVAIAELFDTQPLLWDKASEATVRQQMPQAQIIHLATHGLLEYGDPQESGVRDFPGAIALAPSGTDDGLLTSAEIQQMDLNADLVVLSACDTGRGRISGDGVIGLSRSLITAGVPSVVVSLWQVPDQPTAFLMKEFYQNLQHTPDKAQALRQAMLTTMETHPEPINWAAFTLIGEAE
ncbi:MAG: CHAT domain-containing protein [Thainema sp.]